MSPSNQARIAALPAHLQELARRRLAGRAEQSDRIAPADRGGPLPMSFAQQRLWFLSEFEPGEAEYNSAVALRLVGTLDRAALAAALQDLMARHESLRTTFDEVDGVGRQIVHPAGELNLRVVDLPSNGVPARDALDRLLLKEYSEPFDLRRGPLLRPPGA